MKRLFLLLEWIIPVVLYSQPVPTSVKLSGFSSKEGFMIYSNDYFGEHSSPLTFTNSNEKQFTIEFPTLFYKTDFSGAPIYILPGEKMTIQKAGNSFVSEVGNEIRNNELALLKNLVTKLGPIYGVGATDNIPIPIKYFSDADKKRMKLYGKYSRPPAASLEQRDTALYHIYLERKTFIDEYAAQKKISTFFREYITNYIFYSYLDNALSGYLATNKEIDPLLERQIGLATLADQQNELLIIDKYRSFLNTYNLYLSGDSSQGHGNYKSQLESALKNFGGNSKEYLSYIIAKNAIRKGDQNLTTLLNIFRSICKNERYLQRINEDEALLNLEKYGSGSDELVSLNMEKTSLQNLVKATGAKIVFVDFWAGWCVPCMKELKYSSELAKNFSNDRRIKFMFISMDYSLPVWKKSVDSFNGLMTPDNSYLLLKGFSSNFAIKYHIQAIPRYLVINSNGEILNLDAPGPSDHKIIAYLNSFLNN